MLPNISDVYGVFEGAVAPASMLLYKVAHLEDFVR